MKKTLFRWLIALVIVLPCMMLTAFAAERTVTASGYCGGDGDGTNLTWTLYEDGELVISGTGAMISWSSPWQDVANRIKRVVIEDGVTSIGVKVFQYYSSLTSVVIGDDVTEIGFGAFDGCVYLNDVKLGSSVEVLGNMSFANCNSLAKITIPRSVRNIVQYALGYNESLTTIIVEAGNEHFCVVDGVLFTKDMTTLVVYPAGLKATSYTIPDSVTVVNCAAFSLGSYLTEITIPAATAVIDTDAFLACNLKKINLAADNTAFTLVDGVLYTADMKTMIAYPIANGEAVFHMPEGVEYIQSGSAYRNQNLVSVCLPDSVTVIDNQTFSYDTNLRSVVIGAGVNKLYWCPFRGCTNLKDVYYVGDEAGWQALRNNNADSYDDPIFYANVHYITRDQLRTMTGEDGIILSAHCAPVGAEVTVVGQIPAGYVVESVLVDGTAIDGDTFIVSGNHTVVATFAPYKDLRIIASGDCGERVAWTLFEDGELYISGEGAMANYSFKSNSDNVAPWYPYREQVSKVTVADGVTLIGVCAFLDCTNLTEINLPKTIRTINGGIGYGCTSLTTITVDGDNPIFHVVDGVLYAQDMTQLVLYPAGRTDTSYIVPDSVTHAWACAFAYASNLKHVTLSKSFAAISSYAFAHCTGLTEVTIPDGVATIYNQAFDGCTSLTRVEFLGDAPQISGDVFTDCGNELTIYCHEGADGWPADETWLGRPLMMIKKPVQSNFGYFSLEVIKTIVVDGQSVDICRWVWTPFEA